MNPTKRIIVNTFAQHVRSVCNICLSLYSTRLVLEALGEVDYGIYSLVAGLVAMLGFITNALVITTQRHLSFYHGKGNLKDVQRIFSNSLFLHSLLGLALVCILFAIKPFFFDGSQQLNITSDRMDTASLVYTIMVAILFITFITATYRAVFIARENIVFISIIDILDGVIKLLLAIWLLYLQTDQLAAYAWMMLGIMCFNMLCLVCWALKHFKECTLFPRLHDINKETIKQITGFATWTVYSLGCIIVRTQGIAIVLNRFFTSAINAAYGIATQVLGAVQFIAQSVLNAMTPQIVKAEGAGNRQKMIYLSELASKYCTLLIALAVIPLTFETDAILQLWLGKVPANTAMFCRIILISNLLDQLTRGLSSAIYAVGRIRNYTICVSTVKVLTPLLVWIALYKGVSLTIAMSFYAILEFICAMIRIPFLTHMVGLSLLDFFQNVIIKLIMPLAAMTICCWLTTQAPTSITRIFITALLSTATGLAAIWLTSLETKERHTLINIVRNKIK